MKAKTNRRTRTLVVRSVGLLLGATIALLGQPLDGQEPGGGCAGGAQCYVLPDWTDVCEANWDLTTGCNMGIDICSGCVVDDDEEDLNFY